MERVGVRELRQNLSVYLRRVKKGESLEVTEHGHPVAVLAPHKPPPDDWYARMVANGRIAREGKGSLADVPLPRGRPSTKMSISEALQEQREERLP